jgi:fumigallin biosynthesis monooxygenase-like protein
MQTNVERRTVDLSRFPDLVVIYLGMRVNRLAGLKTLFGFGPKIAASAKQQPDGLLVHETVVYSLFPMHIGMRQYWRDLEALLAWTRSEPHRDWWKSFLKDSGGTGFWHETYLMRGGMEAIYDDVPTAIGFSKFALMVPARGAMFGATARCHQQGGGNPVLSEAELYGENGS